MANRLTDTTIWKKQKWFKRLPIEYKLAWKYLTDECDHAGVWKIDLSELLEDMGLEGFDFEDFVAHCNKDFDKKTGKGITRERVMHFDEDHVWITGFMTFQYGGKTHIIKTGNNAVPSALEILKSFGLYDLAIKLRYFKLESSLPPQSPSKPSEPAQTPLQKEPTPLEGVKGGKDKDIDIDKEKVSNELPKEVNNPPASKVFEIAFWESEKMSFFNGGDWIFKFCTDKKIKIDEFDTYAKEFISDIELTEDFKTLKELRSHFTFWYNKKKKNNGTGYKHNTGEPKVGTSDARTKAVGEWGR